MIRVLISTLLILFSVHALAGGPKCAPGYCLDEDGNGCHPCPFVEPRAISEGDNTCPSTSERACLQSVVGSSCNIELEAGVCRLTSPTGGGFCLCVN